MLHKSKKQTGLNFSIAIEMPRLKTLVHYTPNKFKYAALWSDQMMVAMQTAEESGDG